MPDIRDKCTRHLRNALDAAAELARQSEHENVEPEHLLYGLVATRGGLSAEILAKFKLDPEKLRALIGERHRPTRPAQQEPLLSAESKRVLQKAVFIAGAYHHRYVSTEHLLAAILELLTPTVQEMLTKNEVVITQVQQQLHLVLRSTSKFPDVTAMMDGGTPSGSADDIPGQFGAGPSGGNVLELFTTNLTDASVQQNIDPVIGRTAEIDRVIQILCRRTKNNPVLIGEPGVGKTAIVEGLAKKILHSQVPEILLDKKILALDLGLMLAGTMYRGEFEQRLKNAIAEIKKDPDVILFIDEMHTLTGAGAAPGSMDAANILKPALARGDIRCIGATTLEEYRKHIETDPALERRFQSIMVKEPTPEKTVAILQGIRQNYETFHRVTITDDALQAAVRLSTRYLPDRFLPDKAIDLLDEAAARIRVRSTSNGAIQKLKQIRRGIELLEKNKHQAIVNERYDDALDYKAQEDTARGELQAAEDAWRREQTKTIGTISEHDIAQLVASTTGIPIAELVSTETGKLTDLEAKLKRHVIGQDTAVRELVRAIRRSRTGVALEKRPVGSFIFLGPSGVGKTELAKQLAAELFADEQALVKIDMSEFRESFNVSKLIGSPPGYVGYRESGQLTEAVRRKPYSVVLFDEIEKAHPEIFNILLQVMEDGELTDATGKRVNFRNTIIIMTSNVGLKDFVASKHIGFSDLADSKDLYDEMKGYLEKSLADQFRPEFLNRVDRVIVFRPLGLPQLKKIATAQIAALNARLAQQGLTLKLGRGVVDFLATNGFDPQQGARLIRKNIQEYIEDPLAEGLLEQKFTKGAIIKGKLDNGTITLA